MPSTCSWYFPEENKPPLAKIYGRFTNLWFFFWNTEKKLYFGIFFEIGVKFLLSSALNVEVVMETPVSYFTRRGECFKSDPLFYFYHNLWMPNPIIQSIDSLEWGFYYAYSILTHFHWYLTAKKDILKKLNTPFCVQSRPSVPNATFSTLWTDKLRYIAVKQLMRFSLK